jgi:hypothetical protein
VGWQPVGNIIIYVPEHFKPTEFFPPNFGSFKTKNEVYNREIWKYANPMVLITMDRLRSHYGRAYINTWDFSSYAIDALGNHKYRGFRPRNCEVGATLSYHKFGCAVDMVFANISTESIIEDILADPFDPVFEYITCIEENVSWLHFDVRPWDKANKGVLKVLP